MPKFRILSLDGGGAWALIQVRVLMKIYSETAKGHDILADFDLVAANSGGSIVAAGLAEDLSLAQILDYFKDNAKRRAIFVALPFYRKVARLLGLGPRYYAAKKLDGLRAVMPQAGGRAITALPDFFRRRQQKRTDLLLVGFDYDRERAQFFRTKADSMAASGAGAAPVTLAQAVHASTNAPINYFDEPALIPAAAPGKPPRRYWDGAITGLNNPVVAAIVEAKAGGVRNADIEVLSIGTGNVFLPMADSPQAPDLMQARASQNLLADIKKISGSILADPPDAATFIAHVMLDQPLPPRGAPPFGGGCLIRMNPLIQPFCTGDPPQWSCPTGLTMAEFKQLAALDMDAAEDADVALIEKFCAAWIDGGVHNQPVRAKSTDLACEIGHRLFGGALGEWKRRMAAP
jgi:predicted acylesterase/phospholipase RssA